ncbi:MAG TPA: TIGR03618 family F420-dependent PPOX class oxidoreductase [Candidatus Eisenbacteria bacterium]|nr:TIGR03618 family F420-dependent PPOX class oxidoreductase [Candidatus Eisenbacteria bacterium]
MTVGEAIEFLKTHHRGVLVARRKDGSLQMTLVSPVVTGDDLIITARASTYKVKNIRRNPEVSLLVFGEKFHGSEYIQIDGTAEVIPQPEAMDIVLNWHRQIRGEPENWDEIRQKTLAENRVAIRVTIARVGPQKRV